MGNKPYSVTSTCCKCGSPVELDGGPKLNVLMFQDAKEAECSVCNPKSQWKRVEQQQEKKKVHVVAFVYQGVLESVHVFAEDHLKAAQDKKTEILNSKSFHENEDTVGLYENVEVE